MDTFYAYITKDLAKTFDTAVLLTRYYALWKKHFHVLNWTNFFFISKLNKLDFRHELYRNGSCRIKGLARRESICLDGSYAIVKDDGLSSGFGIAHELGHM